MAIKSSVLFDLGFYGDGSSTSVNFVLATAPLVYELPHQDSVMATTFDIVSLRASDVINVTVVGGSPGITSASITTLGTILAVTFSSAPSSGTLYTLKGAFIF